MLRITISKSGAPPTTTSFDKREITIGRTPSNDIRIPEAGVSSSHARLLYTDGSLTLIDLSSTNGTFVNGSRIQGPHMVQPGDEVYVCSYKLEFDLGPASQPTGPTGGYGAVPPELPGPPPPIDAPPPPIGGPPPPIAGPFGGAPPPIAPPPAPVGAPPPPIAAPPSIPPSPRPDPSLPPPLDTSASAPPVLDVPSHVGLGGGKTPDMPTLPPMIGGPSLAHPDPPAAPAAPPPMADLPPEAPPLAGPPPMPSAPPPMPSAPPPVAEPPLMPAPHEPAADPAPPLAPAPELGPVPPSSTPSTPSAGPITPSTSAPSAKGELDMPTAAPNAYAPSEPKVVLGSQAPVRTGATMMADHIVQQTPEPPAPPAAAQPQAPGAWSMPRVGPPEMAPVSVARPTKASGPATVSPSALAGMQRGAQTREACRQAFSAVRDAWLADPSLDDDALIAKLRSSLEDLKGVVGHLEPMSLSAQLQTELCGVGPLQPLLRDRQVREILLNGPRRATVTKSGQAAESPETTFSSDVALEWVVRRLTGTSFGPDEPVIEATTAEGHRIHAVHQSLAVGGPVVSIRRASSVQHRYDLAQLTSSATLSDVVAKLLASAVQHGLRIAVFAGPGASAYPVAAALALAAPSDQRYVIVRPDHEPALLPTDAIVLQATRPHAMPGLVDAALGLAPSHLLIHGIAGVEAVGALAALGRGYKGVVLTSRAASAEAGLRHLATLSGLDGSSATVETRALRVSSSLDVIIVVNRFADGITRVTQVSSPGVSPSGTAVVTDLISFDPHSRNWTHASALQNFITEYGQRGISLSVT